MPRKPASDSIAGKTAAANRQEVEYRVPDGLAKLNKSEGIAWNQYTAAKDSWKASELRALHALVKMESKRDDMETESRLAPHVVENASGSFVPHPIYAMVRDQEKLIQSQLRVLGLNSPHNVAVKNAQEGKAAHVSQGRGKRAKPQLSLLT